MRMEEEGEGGEVRYARMNGGEKSLDNGNVPGDPDTDWNIVRKGIDVQGYY